MNKNKRIAPEDNKKGRYAEDSDYADNTYDDLFAGSDEMDEGMDDIMGFDDDDDYE